MRRRIAKEGFGFLVSNRRLLCHRYRDGWAPQVATAHLPSCLGLGEKASRQSLRKREPLFLAHHFASQYMFIPNRLARPGSRSSVLWRSRSRAHSICTACLPRRLLLAGSVAMSRLFFTCAAPILFAHEVINSASIQKVAAPVTITGTDRRSTGNEEPIGKEGQPLGLIRRLETAGARGWSSRTPVVQVSVEISLHESRQMSCISTHLETAQQVEGLPSISWQDAPLCVSRRVLGKLIGGRDARADSSQTARQLMKRVKLDWARRRSRKRRVLLHISRCQ